MNRTGTNKSKEHFKLLGTLCRDARQLNKKLYNIYNLQKIKCFHFQQTVDSWHIQTKELKLHFWQFFLNINLWTTIGHCTLLGHVYTLKCTTSSTGGKLDNTGKCLLRQHSYRHIKVHIGTYCQVSLVHKKCSASESKWLCI